MTDTEAIKQITTQAVLETAKSAVLVINEEGRRQSMSPKYSGPSENTRHRTRPSLRQPFFNRNAKEKYTELKNTKIQATDMFYQAL